MKKTYSKKQLCGIIYQLLTDLGKKVDVSISMKPDDSRLEFNGEQLQKWLEENLK